MDNYLEKYEKYKYKYIELKRQYICIGGVTKTIINRMKKEIEEASKHGYTVIPIEEYIEYIYTNVQYNKSIHIKIGNNYPFEDLMINGVEYKNITPQKFIYSMVDSIYFSKKNMLVYCHGEMNFNDKKHWMYDEYFLPIITEKNDKSDDIVPLTIDIKYNNIYKPTFKGDGFSDKFLDNNKEMFDYIFVPDCDGIWYTCQKSKKYEELYKLVDLMVRVFKMVKPNGILFISKFIDAQKMLLDLVYYTFYCETDVDHIKKNENGVKYIVIYKK